MKTTLATLLALALFAATANAAEIYNGANGNYNIDTWNTASNWNSGAGPVPSGVTDVEIADGKKPSVLLNTTPAYTGNLTIGVGSLLQLGQTNNAGILNALGTGSITMKTGSDLTMRYSVNSTHSQDLILTGNAILAIGRSTSAHHKIRTWTGDISGAGLLTVHTTNNQALLLQGDNSGWSGGMVAGGSETENNGERIKAQAIAALGTGDVTMNGGVSLYFDTNEVMANTATLTLNGTKSGKDAAYLILANGTNTTIASLILNGTTYDTPGSVFSSTSGLVDGSGNNLISGLGTITIGVPEPASLALFGIGGLMMLRRRSA